MRRTISVSTFKQELAYDKKYWAKTSPEYRLGVLEKLRLQSGNFLYEYPARLSRVIEVVRKTRG